MTSSTVERMLRQARDAGIPREQVEYLLSAGYLPQPVQMKFHAACRECDHDGGPTEVGFGGARGPGKSHATMAQVMLDDCQRRGGLKALMLRRVGKAVREAFEDMRWKLLARLEHDWNKGNQTLSFPNGSRVILGHFKDERDIDNYLGLEYDVIAVEEATTLSSSKFASIRTCNRTSRPDWRPRIYTNANPGGIGHAWYKERFILPYQLGNQTETRFIPGTVDDNVFVNDGYRSTLEKLTGWRKRAWLYGDWDIAAGQFFTNFRTGTHVISPLTVEKYWPEKWLAMDYGWVHPTVVQLFARDNQGLVYVVDEYRASMRLPEAHNQEILKMIRKWDVEPNEISEFRMPADMWKSREGGVTLADSYRGLGWPQATRAEMDRVQGASHLLRLLGDVEAGIPPKLYIFNTCTDLIATLPRLEHDPRNPEDVLKVDIDEDGTGGDDSYDCLRYGQYRKISGKATYSKIKFRV